ncbi:hypothetical protein DVH24_013940 [Malus domestica]|uniref:AATF leucine zipper-containing domain-containing protein n=1 Tax=Malus domestica TaxID=3750 RepID=A0A498JH48_MALDO|nr:hypothetical protein DVH24_013940 [Malus domestica]
MMNKEEGESENEEEDGEEVGEEENGDGQTYNKDAEMEEFEKEYMNLHHKEREETSVHNPFIFNYKLALWDKALEFRFLLQKAFSSSHRLPQVLEGYNTAKRELHAKKRKIVDRRASNSRKLSIDSSVPYVKLQYNVYEKIVNFMAPETMAVSPMLPDLNNLFGLKKQKPASAVKHLENKEGIQRCLDQIKLQTHGWLVDYCRFFFWEMEDRTTKASVNTNPAAVTRTFQPLRPQLLLAAFVIAVV